MAPRAPKVNKHGHRAGVPAETGAQKRERDTGSARGTASGDRTGLGGGVRDGGVSLSDRATPGTGARLSGPSASAPQVWRVEPEVLSNASWRDLKDRIARLKAEDVPLRSILGRDGSGAESADGPAMPGPGWSGSAPHAITSQTGVVGASPVTPWSNGEAPPPPGRLRCRQWGTAGGAAIQWRCPTYSDGALRGPFRPQALEPGGGAPRGYGRAGQAPPGASVWAGGDLPRGYHTTGGAGGQPTALMGAGGDWGLGRPAVAAPMDSFAAHAAAMPTLQYQSQASQGATSSMLEDCFKEWDLSDKMAKPIFMPGKYDGSGHLTEYLAHFDLCRRVNGWNHEEAGIFLGLSLQGLARRLLGGMSPYVGYPAMREALIARFQPKNLGEMYKAMLRGKERMLRGSACRPTQRRLSGILGSPIPGWTCLP